MVVLPHRFPARRSRFPRSFARFCALLSLLAGITPAVAQVNVTTHHYDNSRTGANLSETVLTPANVNQNTFGKLFSDSVDGQIYAEPLYISGVAVSGKGTHNVVYVATMNNSLYALDADTGQEYWRDSFGTPVNPVDVEHFSNITHGSHVGILGTPVIDLSTNTIYFVSRNEAGSGSGATFSQYLNAIDITSGAAKFGSPKQITATYTSADGTLTFNPKIQNQRAALTLANGSIYIAWASHDDLGAYHGWVMAYKASTLAQIATYSDTTSGTEGGIWQAGNGLTVDTSGNLLLSTGNGSFGASTQGVTQTGNSFIKLSPTLGLLDYFTPYNSASLNSGDQDLGASGVLGLPGTTYIVGGGKQGVLYVVDANNMGHFNSSQDQIVQEFQAVAGKGTSHIHGVPVYFNSPTNGPTIYVWGENDYLKAFTFDTGRGLFNTTPIHKSTMTAPVTNASSAMPGGFLTVTANGSKNGIIWAATPYNGGAEQQTVQGILHAFDASTLAELWNDKQNDSRDDLGYFAKYVPPTVANGKLYLATFGPLDSADGSGALVVYGLLGNKSNLIPDGDYQILSAGSGLALDVTGASTSPKAILIQNTIGSGKSQLWHVSNLGSNIVTLKNANSGDAADDLGNSTSLSTLIGQWPPNGYANQQWAVASVGGGRFTLTCQASGYLLDVTHASLSPGAQIDQYTANGQKNQQWQFQLK